MVKRLPEPPVAVGALASEMDPCEGDSPIQQGDIIRWEDPTPPWQRYAVTVTADCDIAERKHGGVLSYVPVLQLHEYWQLITLPKKLADYVGEKFQPAILQRVRASARQARPEFSGELSDQAILDMVDTVDGEVVLEALRVSGKEGPSFLRQLRALRSTRANLGAFDAKQLGSLLAELRAAIAGDASAPAKPSAVFDELAKTVQRFPGDAFFLSHIPAEASKGFVAYLRLVREIPVDAVAVRPADLRRGAKARRIARLRSPFLYRLTQQLAQVFSDIGLPPEYETQRERLADNVRSDLHASLDPELRR